MTAPASATTVPVYKDLLTHYEIDQRLRITKRAAIALLVSTVVGFGGNLGYVFSRPDPTSLLPVNAIIAIFTAIAAYSAVLIIAYVAAQRRKVGLASYLTVLGCTLLVVGIQLVWIMVARNSGSPFGLDDQSWQMFMAYFVPIALCVVIGDNALLYVTVVILNVISTVILAAAFLSTGHDMSSRHQFIGLLLGALMTEWAVAIITLAMRSGFRRIIFDATQLQYAVERAKKLDDLKDQFISSVNHELRNPVMALRGYLDALTQLDPTMPLEQRRHFIAQAVNSCQNIQELIESILTVRRIDQSLSDLDFDVVDLHEVITTAASQIDPREVKSGERPLHLTLPQGLTVWGDRIRLQQIITNLLSNAMRYSAPGTSIEITARLVTGQDANASRSRKEAAPDMVEIMVRDHGFGIPPDMIPLLFQKFVRLPRDLGSTTIGNGLGLFACREIAEALGGSIWVESRGIPGDGSTFFVRLPATQHAAMLAAPPRVPEPAGVR